jgi:hypothetical protein
MLPQKQRPAADLRHDQHHHHQQQQQQHTSHCQAWQT